LSNSEAPAALKFSGKRVVGLQKLVYLYQETIFKKNKNGSVLQNEGEYIRKNIISMQNKNKSIPNKRVFI
jgi:hypothetical protein